ncbi:MAG TPA: hypothetical protein VL688_09440, partial [Verrucomicrobiae bacterium]|nr:hypothetical protein [Verrucomicrobiae bacterium]
MTQRSGLLTKSLAAFLAFLLLFDPFQSVRPSWVWAAGPAAFPLTPEILSSLETLNLPADWGTVRESFFPEGKSDKAVIFIEDAHAVYDSGKSIVRLIGYFRETYGVPLVFLEGGEGELDSLFFKSFPDAALRARVLDEYLKQGELSGGEAASVLEDSPDARYYGVETESLYAQNKSAYLDAVRNDEEIHRLLKQVEDELSRRSQEGFSTLTKIFWAKHHAFRTDILDLLDYLKETQVFFPAEKQALFRESFPELHKILSSEAAGTKLAAKDLMPRVRAFADEFRVRHYETLSASDRKLFNQDMQAFQTADLSGGEFLGAIEGWIRDYGFAMEIPAELKPAARQTLTLASIQGSRVFDEVREMEKLLVQVLPETGEERALLEDFFRLDVLQDLAALKLSREDWQALKGKSPSQWIVSLPDNKALGILDRGLSRHYDFYELAIRRDEALFRNSLRAMKEGKTGLSVLVTGGFHAGGIARKLKIAKIPYILVTPNIQSPGSGQRYRQVMQGRTSYMKYFRGSLWDALAQDYAAKMAASLDPAELTPSLKLWRDRLIQNSIAEKKITRANHATRYIDALVQALRKDYEKNSPLYEENISEEEIRA